MPANKRDAYYRHVVAHGLLQHESSSLLDVEAGQGTAWLDKLFRTPKLYKPGRPERFVNRFKLGADPEFVFIQRTRDAYEARTIEQRADAAMLGLKQGPAFGADNNGRLAEIRPYPNRSALRVLASVLGTMRWLAMVHPETLAYEWVCGAYILQDGIGGHVHFGRFRPTRDDEVRALDNLCETMISLNLYPLRECLARRNGDARGQHYGMPGDFRPQGHGYEYRTFPSWLDNPWLAFFTLVLSKLAVYDPKLLLPWLRAATPEVQRQRLTNLLAYYKNLDDDARLAYIVLQRQGMPLHTGGDFRSRWGITYRTLTPSRVLVPLSIKPSAQDIEDVFNYLVLNIRIPERIPEPTWEPSRLPAGFRPCLENANTTQHKGLGEMIWDLVYHEGRPVSIAGTQRGSHPIQVGVNIWNRLTQEEKRKVAHLVRSVDSENGWTIYLSAGWREGDKAKQVKDILTSGLFPVWKAKEATQESYDRWRARGVAKPTLRWRTKTLYETVALAR